MKTGVAQKTLLHTCFRCGAWGGTGGGEDTDILERMIATMFISKITMVHLEPTLCRLPGYEDIRD